MVGVVDRRPGLGRQAVDRVGVHRQPGLQCGCRRVHEQLVRWDRHVHPEVVRDLMRELELVPR